MHTLDSRSLRLGDCFGQKFPTPGEVRYFVTPGELIPNPELHTEDGFLITVRPAVAGAASNQHDVIVSLEAGTLTVSPSTLEIQAGDGVLWHTLDPEVLGFQVAGAGPTFRFNSARIRDNAVYTHAFGVPGSYRWQDPNGSGVSGRVDVEAFEAKSPEDRDRWFQMLENPVGIQIKGRASSPASVKIVVGQTVFWSVMDSPGVALCDERLLHTHYDR